MPAHNEDCPLTRNSGRKASELTVEASTRRPAPTKIPRDLERLDKLMRTTAMKPVTVRLKVYEKDKTITVEGAALLDSTNADTLREVISLLGYELDTDSSKWEAFFYNSNEDGLLLAYLGSSRMYGSFLDAKVLKYN